MLMVQALSVQVAEMPNGGGQLISREANNAMQAAFNELERTVANNSQTLDGLVREMLRPILKIWLDDNLPRMVERLVRAEIERVASPRGR
jgi:uncharacterized protein